MTDAKHQFWARAQESVERLRADPTAWQGYLDEIAIWDELAGDGLAGEAPYYTMEEEAEIEAEYARIYGGDDAVPSREGKGRPVEDS